MKLIFKTPINSLSFGQVSFNLLKEFYKKKIDLCIFPIGKQADLSAYKIEQDFADWIKTSILDRYKKLDSRTPCLSLWHLNGSEEFIGKRSYLYTFHELNSLTQQEKAVVSLHDQVFVSSKFSKEAFDSENCTSIPLGFDESFKPSNKRKFPKDCVHFILIGKYEKRKNTDKIIRLWAEKYGNNKSYQLTCLINNPFLEGEKLNWEIAKALSNKKYFNINFLPTLRTNIEVNDLINSADIDLSGLSGGEGWGIPAFTATGLGKWSCVLNCSAHTEWATKENCILIEPDGKKDPWDNTFFQEGQDFNQGQLFDVFDDTIIQAFETAETKAKTPNEVGTKLRTKFTYEKMASDILSHIENDNQLKIE